MGPGPGMMPGWGGGPGPGMMPGWGMMQGWGGGMPGPGMMQGRGGFAPVDQNQDGLVTGEEAAAHAEGVFRLLDLDDDGRLTFDEFLLSRAGFGGGYNQAMQDSAQARKKARFDPMDANGDGVVTQQEFLIAARTHFEEADVDGNGVTPWEYRYRQWN